LTTFAAELARARPDEIAIRDEHQAWGWGKVDEVLNRVTNGLLACDLGPDRRIAVFAENGIETAMANLGGLLAGASVVPVNFHLTAEEAAYILEDSATRVLFVDAITAERGAEAARRAGVPRVIGWGDGQAAGVESWEVWLAAQSPADPPADHPPRPNLLYTSGTTGPAQGYAIAADHVRGRRYRGRAPANLKQSPMAAFGTPSGRGSDVPHRAAVRCAAAGRRRAVGDPRPVRCREDARRDRSHRIGNSVMVPTHFVRLLALPEPVRRKYDVSSLQSHQPHGRQMPGGREARHDRMVGAGVPGRLRRQRGGHHLHDHLRRVARAPGLRRPGHSSLHRHDPGRRRQSAAPGSGGPALLRGRNRPRRSSITTTRRRSAAAHIAPGIFTLGEIAYMDEDGYVYITDRFSDMIVSGGVNIYPAESEQMLIRHPAMLDVACIGVPHAEMGEELKAL
jgi:long-chain acyl-CoA synthetase